MDAVTRLSVDNSTRAEFRRDGHVMVPGLLPRDETGKARTAISTAVEKFSTETRDLEERNTYGKAFLQVMNLWTRDEAVRKFVFDQRFAAVAAQLLGVEKVRLYHDQALFKEPGGGHTPWHQDQYYWPLDTEKTVTMWMPLVDIDVSMGMLTFASGSHLNGAVADVPISDESEDFYERFVADHGFEISRQESMKAGDATFHLGWTIHSAGANSSINPRDVMTIIYFADGARVTTPRNENQVADLNAWLGGRLPGEFADGELNPVLFGD